MRTLMMCVAFVAACGPVDKSVRRAVMTDETPFGSSRAEVKQWHLAHDWCEVRRWDASDEYKTCVDRSMHTSGAVRALFRFEDDHLVSAALYAPVPCESRRCQHVLGVQTALEDAPFVAFDAGVVRTPTDAGRAGAPDLEAPAEIDRMLDAMQVELEERYGAPAWTNAHRTARVWESPGDTVGLFMSADGHWVVETHQAPVPVAAAPGR